MENVYIYILPDTDLTNANEAISRLRSLGYNVIVENVTADFQIGGEFPGGPIVVVTNQGTVDNRLVTLGEVFDVNNLVNFVQAGFSEGGDNGSDPDDTFGLPVGGNLFDLNLPKFVYLILGVAATYKTIDSQKTLGQVGYGSIAAYSWSKYLSK